MSWVKLDDRYFSNGKIRRVSIGARLLHVASMCHCAAALSDGLIPLGDLLMVQAACGVTDARSVAELVEVGLWDEDFERGNVVGNGVTNAVTGYRVHDYLEYNPPSARVIANREATKVRVDKYRKSLSNGVTNAATNAVSNGHCNIAPVPVPVPVFLPEPVQEKKEEIQDPLRGDILKVFEHYRTLHPRACRKPRSDQKEWRHIRARLSEGSTVEDLNLAIDGYHRDAWHVEKGQLGLELIVRDASHVAQGIGFAEKPTQLSIGQSPARPPRDIRVGHVRAEDCNIPEASGVMKDF